jgi:hypothetical protein|tara:strand:+ start:323 stop:568 length:246 start_codon:yes stop_codon:yes gene_type:complete
MLTDVQSAQINNTEVYTLDYETEALQSCEDLTDELEVRATNVILEQTAWDAREDLGGITVYFRDSTLVAFYDYEQFRGTVF